MIVQESPLLTTLLFCRLYIPFNFQKKALFPALKLNLRKYFSVIHDTNSDQIRHI